MNAKAARTINLFVVVLMTLEILGASATALPSSSAYRLSICSEESQASILGSFLFEKAEEENEKTEEENAHLTRVVLLDFASIALSLSAHHSPHYRLSLDTDRYSQRPPLHQLNCVFRL
jgi:hypothetical protein